MYDDPDWIHEMVAFLEEFLTAVSANVLAEVSLSYVYACDDIAYKTSALISPAMFHKFFFEPTRRMAARVRRAGVPVSVMDSDGNLDEFAEIYRQAGFNTLCPIEVAAGNDLLAMRQRFGKSLALQGGFDKRILTRGKEAIHAEVMRLFPRMMAEGGFTPNIDHAVPENVSFDNYRYYIEFTRMAADNPGQYLRADKSKQK
jgi:uroporphyrinogen decarboxylase